MLWHVLRINRWMRATCNFCILQMMPKGLCPSGILCRKWNCLAQRDPYSTCCLHSWWTKSATGHLPLAYFVHFALPHREESVSCSRTLLSGVSSRTGDKSFEHEYLWSANFLRLFSQMGQFRGVSVVSTSHPSCLRFLRLLYSFWRCVCTWSVMCDTPFCQLGTETC